ncbi:putative small multidrug export protein [Fulvivirga imtechensis AK7]|uniref:Putative small multidrug export protein n=1 Tax=Fulvivirga imtechensis AK7 TaxID=1237149 RepID=L8JLD6_9BACT|nr:small multi-drug export protein [Fulvivirga imtechensis]ELR68294.1 putative small multidrug export protein [Fulvivirga imtechensis AK7]
MINDIFFTVLFSISPLGEARVGIPYGILNGVHPIIAFLSGLVANLLVYPLVYVVLQAVNKKMWQYRVYKKQSVKVSKRAKKLTGNSIHKYGFWGLMVFVMIPLPVTGAYMGSIAAILFKLPPKQAFKSISLGVIISCLLVTIGAYFGHQGIKLL